MTPTTEQLTVTGVALVIVAVIVAIGVFFIIRSNRGLAHRYEALREETVQAWKVYLEDEHRKLLSETAATVARLNAVARTLLRRDLPEDVVAALSDRA